MIWASPHVAKTAIFTFMTFTTPVILECETNKRTTQNVRLSSPLL